jgi:hypothetical protein
VAASVADPGCLFRIRICLFRIPDSGSKIFRIPDPGPQWIIYIYCMCCREPGRRWRASGARPPPCTFLTQKIVSKLSEIWCSSRIWILIFYPSRIMDPRIKKRTGSRIPDPQDWGLVSPTVCSEEDPAHHARPVPQDPGEGGRQGCSRTVPHSYTLPQRKI